jgi:hypothetical protein
MLQKKSADPSIALHLQYFFVIAQKTMPAIPVPVFVTLHVGAVVDWVAPSLAYIP